MVFLKEFFEKVDYEKNQQTTKTMHNYLACIYLLQVLTIDVKKDGLVNYVRDTAKKSNQADRLEILINVPGNNGNLQ